MTSRMTSRASPEEWVTTFETSSAATGARKASRTQSAAMHGVNHSRVVREDQFTRVAVGTTAARELASPASITMKPLRPRTKEPQEHSEGRISRRSGDM